MKNHTPRNPYLLPLVGVLAAAVLFALIAAFAPDDWGASSTVSPPEVYEVDVDVHHPGVRHSPQVRRSTPPPRVPLVKATPTRR